MPGDEECSHNNPRELWSVPYRDENYYHLSGLRAEGHPRINTLDLWLNSGDLCIPGSWMIVMNMQSMKGSPVITI